ncbi:Tex-like N-terminal domain-containing protein [Pseudomonas aeruginosa]
MDQWTASTPVSPKSSPHCPPAAFNRSKSPAAVALLDEGSTVPFIARYRKEVTGEPRRYSSHAGRAPALPARTGRTPRRDPRQHQRSGAS